MIYKLMFYYVKFALKRYCQLLKVIALKCKAVYGTEKPIK